MDELKLGAYEEEYYQKVYDEFGKTKEDIDEYVALLKSWTKEQPHLPNEATLTGIRSCIVACKFSVEKAKEKLEMYYTIRNIMPEIFTVHPLSPEMIFHTQVFYCVPLPKLTKNHERVLYMQLNPNFGPENFRHDQMIIQITHLVEVLIQKDFVFNFVAIFDNVGAKVGHIPKFSPMLAKKIAICLEKVYANRIAAIHLVNVYSFVETLWNNVLMPLFPAKIKNRIKVCKSTDVLFNEIDKSLLPKDIGGEEKSLEELRQSLMTVYREMKPRFDSIQYMKVDESLRPSKLRNDDILGYYGSFKQISVD